MGENAIRLLRSGILITLLAIAGTSSAFAGDLEDAVRAYGAGEFEEAATLLRPLSREGNATAQYFMGRMLEQGDGVQKNLDEAVRLYRQASEQGHADAARRLEQFAGKDAGEDSVVLEWYLPAAREGDQDAQYSLGYMHETGWGVSVDEITARRWYQEASATGHDMAQLRLGMMLIAGAGGDKDEGKGIGLLRSAAEAGNRLAEALLQDMFDLDDLSANARIKVIQGLRRTFEEDIDRALETLFVSLERARSKKRKSAETRPISKPVSQPPERDPVSAQAEVIPQASAPVEQVPQRSSTASESTLAPVLPAVSVFAGEKVNINKAIEAAQRGNGDAQVALGIRYLQGDGVPQNLQEGLRWIRSAASQGHQVAQTYLSLWNTQFEDLLMNSSIATTWLMEAGRQWDMDALYQLGVLFETGRGVRRNLPEAQKWFQLAAAMGHSGARQGLQRLQTGNPGGFSVSSTATRPADQGRPWWLWLVVLFILAFLLKSSSKWLVVFRSRWKVPVALGGADSSQKSGRRSVGSLHQDDQAFLDELWAEKPAVNAEAAAEPEPETVSTSVSSGSPQGLSPEQTEALKASLSLETPSSEPSQTNASQSEDTPLTLQPKEGLPEREPDMSRPVKTPFKPVEADISEQQADVSPPADEAARGRGSLSADALVDLRDGISKDALATSRLDASTLFDRPFPIDNEGKVVHREQKDAERLDADALGELPLSAEEKSSSVFATDDLEPLTGGPVAGVEIIEEYYSSTVVGGELPPLLDSQPESPSAAESDSAIEAETCADHDADTLVDKDSDSGDENESTPNADTETVSAPASEDASSDEPLVVTEPAEGISDTTVLPEGDFADEEADHPAEPTELGDSEEMALAEVHLNIGNMFARGDGVAQSDDMAFKWFLRSAEAGLAEGQYMLALCYAEGKGAQQDHQQAQMWLEKAAAQGHAESQNRLGGQNRA